MSERKKFLLRLDSDLFGALEKWAADDLRSVNAQIEFLLRGALKEEGRLRSNEGAQAGDDAPGNKQGNGT